MIDFQAAETLINKVERIWKSANIYTEEHQEFIRLARLGLWAEKRKVAGLMIEAKVSLDHFGQDVSLRVDIGKALDALSQIP